MKAIILTYAPVSESEKEILINTKLYKLAINGCAKELKPNIRICSDYMLQYLLDTCDEKIISIREKPRCPSSRVITPNIEFKGATIICAVEYLIQRSYTDILIVGDNTVNRKELQELIKTGIDKLKDKANIYQYTNGNFNLNIMSIKHFAGGK